MPNLNSRRLGAEPQTRYRTQATLFLQELEDGKQCVLRDACLELVSLKNQEAELYVLAMVDVDSSFVVSLIENRAKEVQCEAN